MKKWITYLGICIVVAILAVPVVYASSVSNANDPGAGISVPDAIGTDACRVTALVYWVNGVKQPTVPITGNWNYTISVNTGDTVAFKVKCSGPGYAFIMDDQLHFLEYKEIPAAGAWFRSTQGFMTDWPGGSRDFSVSTGRKGDSHSALINGTITIQT